MHPKPSLTELPPLPPASGGRSTSRGPAPRRCLKHTKPADNCRSCGTTPRQLERAAAKAKADAARIAAQDELAAQRAAKAAAKEAGRSPAVDALVDDLRKNLRGGGQR